MPFKNYIAQYNTLAGQRINAMYNDFEAECTPKYGSWRFVAIDPTPGGSNIKRDAFVSPNGGENPARICNWNASHHVGSVGNVVNQSGIGVRPSSTGWLGEYYGLGEATRVSIALTTNNSLRHRYGQRHLHDDRGDGKSGLVSRAQRGRRTSEGSGRQHSSE
jgi:hypothetical protein